MHARIKQHQLTRHGARAVHQPDHRLGHVLGRAGAAQWRGLLVAGLDLLETRLPDAVDKPARGDQARAEC